MNFIQAKEIALKELTEISNYLGEKCIFFKTYEVKDKGWVFSYNTEEYLLKQNYSHALAGNHPMFVTLDGKLKYINLEEYDKLFENTWTKVIVE
ncbi:hypothetical protein RFI36_10245 [Acinetobacter gerneri]|uniref:Immunity protein 35 domain-containing protein n=1 Tax=Acinetobacter gerneri TaxID=202952 RepID=A0AAW8JRD0_9GAMM|nr:hypothetical protein [Acinetobacter gerneri]MDQ9010117.1 hypothetical protein [Acinetobacter gerneri]MDQ9014278.1 hypothetical protein [Acinetobacter gerneri]MDQ9025395.1 hypothetical protein [Acinetobacter gerneri]MDQ9052730.1 hypothetical protein [Acinetobacter gerneri]MDQ9060348.1 hypothetical protein [Acinetobacter gerneri]